MRRERCVGTATEEQNSTKYLVRIGRQSNTDPRKVCTSQVGGQRCWLAATKAFESAGWQDKKSRIGRLPLQAGGCFVLERCWPNGCSPLGDPSDRKVAPAEDQFGYVGLGYSFTSLREARNNGGRNRARRQGRRRGKFWGREYKRRR